MAMTQDDRTTRDDVDSIVADLDGSYDVGQPAFLGVDYACVVQPVESFNDGQHPNLTNAALDPLADELRSAGLHVEVRNGTGVMVFK